MSTTATVTLVVADLEDGTRAVTVHGDIDLATAPRLESALRLTVASSPVALDLSGVDFFSSAGATALENLVAEYPGSVTSITAPHPWLRRTLEILGLDSLAPVLAA